MRMRCPVVPPASSRSFLPFLFFARSRVASLVAVAVALFTTHRSGPLNRGLLEIPLRAAEKHGKSAKKPQKGHRLKS